MQPLAPQKLCEIKVALYSESHKVAHEWWEIAQIFPSRNTLCFLISHNQSFGFSPPPRLLQISEIKLVLWFPANHGFSRVAMHS